jgi:hypothetical protein
MATRITRIGRIGADFFKFLCVSLSLCVTLCPILLTATNYA